MTTQTTPTPTPNEIKHQLRMQGQTLRDWAQEHGFKYRTVTDTLAGVRKGHFGEGREVRLALGLPVED